MSGPPCKQTPETLSSLVVGDEQLDRPMSQACME